MKKLLLVLLFSFLLSFPVNALTRFIGAVYWISTDTVKIAWDPVENVQKYEVKLVWLDPDTPFEYNLGFTTDTYMVITRPRVGHFKAMVRSCRVDPDGTEVFSTDWADSTNAKYATVDGEPKPWILFFKVPKVTNINVN